MNTPAVILQVFDTNAAVYQEKYMDVGHYAASLDAFCGSLQPGARLLEVGCGPGNVIRYLLHRRPDLQPEGIDLSPNMIELARQNTPGVTYTVMDCRDIAALPGLYDGILCSFCLPYLSKEETDQLIGDCAALIRPGGVLYISTMEDDYEKSGVRFTSDGKNSLYMFFHEAAFLQAVLEKHGFQTSDLRRQDFQHADGSIMVDLILLAVKE